MFQMYLHLPVRRPFAIKILVQCSQANEIFAGYPSLTLPLEYLNWNGRPFGLIVVASAYQESLLLDVARAWEATLPPRQVPSLLDGKWPRENNFKSDD